MDTKQIVIHKLRQLLLDKFDIPLEEKILDETNLYPDILKESLDKVEFIMFVEDEFGIEILDEDSEKVLTFGGLISHLSNCKV